MAISDPFLANFNAPQRANYVMTQPPIDIEGYISAPSTPVPKPKLSAPVISSVSNAVKPAPPKPTAPVVDPTVGAINNQTAAIGEQTAAFKAADTRARNTQMALAGANFLLEIGNAQNAYVATTGQAQLNILQARNQAADAIYRGHQAGLDRQSEGYNQGQQAVLALAAQGQDVGGAAVGKVQGSFEAMGAFNGMREEINSLREALGFELEEVAYEYQIDNAGIARENAFIGAGLQLGANAALFI